MDYLGKMNERLRATLIDLRKTRCGPNKQKIPLKRGDGGIQNRDLAQTSVCFSCLRAQTEKTSPNPKHMRPSCYRMFDI